MISLWGWSGFTVAAVGTWWSGLNREVVSLQRGLGAVGTWWSHYN